MELRQKNESLESQITELTLLITKQAKLIEYYEEQFRLARRRQFGVSSEKTVIDTDEYRQMGLFNEVETEADKNKPEPEIEEIAAKRRKRKGKRKEDLSSLPMERIDYELPEEERVCPQCGKTMGGIGVDIRRELKIIPAQVVVVEHAAHAYACPDCGKNDDNINTSILKTETPKPLISGSLASPSIVAHIAVQKYSNGMPLYRIEKELQQDGVNVSRQTMANWVIKCTELYLLSLYLMLKTFLLKETVLHADETTVQVLREADRAPQTKSYEWVYRTSGCSQHKIVIYDYKETRSQKHPMEFLADFKGFLHTDGYQAYHNLPSDITVVGCWAHARRYFEKILKNLPKDKREGSDAWRGVAYINMLFGLECEFQELTTDERYKKRLEKSKPIAEAFFVWAETLGALPKSPLGEAVCYVLSQRKYLENVFLDGRTEISNNRCERSVKSFVMGRKAWLFSNTPNGAQASSIMYSIVETAKENGLHPYHYIKYLLEALPNMASGDVESLLPWSDSIPEQCRLPVK